MYILFCFIWCYILNVKHCIFPHREQERPNNKDVLVELGLLSSISRVSVRIVWDWLLSLSDGVPSGWVSVLHIPLKAELCSSPFQT